MGLAFFHTHIHGIDRFFPPQKERYVSFFRVILRNFHESNRFFSPLSSLLSPSTIGYQTRIFRDSLGHFSDNSVRRERERERRTVSPVPLSRRVISEKRERGKRKSIRKKGEEGSTTTLTSGLKARCLTRSDKSFLVKADIALSPLCDRK